MGVSYRGAPDFVILGDVDALRSSAGRLREKGVFFGDIGRALSAVDASGWSGAAADIFRDRFRSQPTRWRDMGAAFERAGNALDEYADVLEQCQQVAVTCREQYARGQELNLSAQWQRSDTSTMMCIPQDPMQLPGGSLIATATSNFARVVSDLNLAGDNCAHALHEACAKAPQERTWLDEAGVFFYGALEALAEYGKLVCFPWYMNVVWADMGTRWWNGTLTGGEVIALQMRPTEMVCDLAQAAWNDPRGTAGNVAAAVSDAQTWMDDPALAAGRLVPDAIVSVATGGAGTAVNRISKIATKADEIYAGIKGLRALDRLPSPGRFPEFHAPNVSAHHGVDTKQPAIPQTTNFRPQPQVDAPADLGASPANPVPDYRPHGTTPSARPHSDTDIAASARGGAGGDALTRIGSHGGADGVGTHPHVLNPHDEMLKRLEGRLNPPSSEPAHAVRLDQDAAPSPEAVRPSVDRADHAPQTSASYTSDHPHLETQDVTDVPTDASPTTAHHAGSPLNRGATPDEASASPKAGDVDAQRQPAAASVRADETPNSARIDNVDAEEHVTADAKPDVDPPATDEAPEAANTDDVRADEVTSEAVKDDLEVSVQREEPAKADDDAPVKTRPNTDSDTSSHTDTDSDPAVASDETSASDSTVTPDETRDIDTDSPETETAPEAPASTGQPNADTPHTKETPDSTTPNNTDNAEHAKPEPKPDSDSPAADEASEAAKTDNIATDNVSPEGNKEAGSPVRADKSTDADPSVDADSAATQSNTSHTDSASPEGKNDPANNTIHDGHVRNPDPDNSVEPGKRGEFDADNSATANNKVSQEEADEASTNGSDEKKKDWQLTPEVEARRAQPATTVDDVCACVTRWDGKNVLAPPNDASEMNTMTRSLIKDIDEIFGRNEDGSLRSYNEWHAKYSKWIEDSPEIYHGAYRSESHLFGEAVPEEAETAGIEGMVHNGMTHHETTGIQETLRRLYDLPEDGVIRFDRIGEPSGQYLGLIGKDGPASFGERSLAPTSVHGEYYVYELNVDDLPEGWSMTVGKVAPWHGGKGGAIQIQFFGPKGTTDLIEEKSIAELMRVGIVRDVTPR